MNKDEFKNLLKDKFLELLPELREKNPKLEKFFKQYSITEEYIKYEKADFFINLYLLSRNDINEYVTDQPEEYKKLIRNLEKLIK